MPKAKAKAPTLTLTQTVNQIALDVDIIGGLEKHRIDATNKALRTVNTRLDTISSDISERHAYTVKGHMTLYDAVAKQDKKIADLYDLMIDFANDFHQFHDHWHKSQPKPEAEPTETATQRVNRRLKEANTEYLELRVKIISEQ